MRSGTSTSLSCGRASTASAAIRRLGDPSGAQEGGDDPGRHEVGVRMPAGQQGLGTSEELDGDCRCGRQRFGCRGAQPGDRLLVAPLRAEHQVIRDVERIRPGVHQRECRLPVQETARRCGNLLIDRVVDELVPKHDAVACLVEQLRVERLVELSDELGRLAVGDRTHVAQRDGIAEHRRDLQQLQRLARQMSETTDHQIPDRRGELGAGRVHLVVASQQTFVVERAQHRRGPERVPSRWCRADW